MTTTDILLMSLLKAQTMHSRLIQVRVQQEAVKCRLRFALKELKEFDHSRLHTEAGDDPVAQDELLELQNMVVGLAQEIDELATLAAELADQIETNEKTTLDKVEGMQNGKSDTV